VLFRLRRRAEWGRRLGRGGVLLAKEAARLGKGRRIHILDTTRVEVALETGTYECSGVVKNDDGTRSRGYKLATLRTLLLTFRTLFSGSIMVFEEGALAQRGLIL